ncbi:MAG: DUF6339 family protein [Chloroflexota bacterium]|nr:DUF6339 family protein [Chloroflexota bacterium]MDE2891776.1 DUF6339 family protein [Chloroflexota bacterium]
MAPLQYYTLEAVSELRQLVQTNVGWYFDLSAPEPILAAKTPRRDTKLELPQWQDLLSINEHRPASTDAANALALFESFSQLSPYQASDQRVWTYLCHNECRSYVAARWLRGYDPDSPGAIERVLNHFFVRGNRSLIRDNGLSRLWWLGSIAHKADPAEPRRFLDILLYRQDVRSALIERPSVSMNLDVLKAIYAVMKEDFETEDRALFQRGPFREWMKNLNRRGGVILLDAVPPPTLDALIRAEAERALSATA